jgi:hypothetical protein
MTATAVFAAQQGSDEFHQSVKAAQAEFSALSGAGSVDPALCAAEAALIAKDPY